MMPYPTMEEVDAASRTQICRWYRFLPSPGIAAAGTDKFDAALERELPIMKRISDRYKELGGFTPEISKALGWDIKES